MKVKNLSHLAFEEIVNCFLEAFADYFVKMPQDITYYKQRWANANVDFNLSYGMFDEERLVGFIIHAIDHRDGLLTAYNTGTGVIPGYRGKGITKSIYEFALKDLKQNGIQKSKLEVITKNEIAIRLYQNIGFKICKNYQCFNGSIQSGTISPPLLEEISLNNLDWTALPHQQFYSWDNQKASIIKGNYHFFQVLHDEQPESFFIINPEQNYISQFDVFNNEVHSWDRLFTGIKQISDSIKINNVDDQLTEKITALNKAGIKNVIDQFEMELVL